MMRKNKFVICLLLLSVIVVSCGKTENSIESFDPVYRNTELSRLSDYSIETFEYDQYDTHGSLLKAKGTAYRIMKTDAETGEMKCICIDPLCSHDENSDCPVVSKQKISVIGLYENSLIFRCSQNINANECRHYNMSTGESHCIFDVGQGTVTCSISGKYLFFIIPDVVDDSSVYSLQRYDISSQELKVLRNSDSLIVINAISNQRIYFGNMYIPGTSSSPAVCWSMDYNGEDYREETDMNFSAKLAIGSYVYGASGKGYNVETDEPITISADDGTTALGYWEKTGKLVYSTCDNLKEGVALNPDIYCEKHGITIEEYNYSKDHKKKLEEEREAIFFGTNTRIMCCDMDGSNEYLLFELPEGIFIESDITQKNRSGCVIDDYMYVNLLYRDLTEKTARINLSTGEIEITE